MAIALQLACSDPVSVNSDVLLVRQSGLFLELTNRSDAPVYHFVADRDILPLLDWVPCSNPATCDGIAPSSTRRIGFDDVIGYQAGSEALVVYHWQLVAAPDDGGFVPDSIRSLTLLLR